MADAGSLEPQTYALTGQPRRLRYCGLKGTNAMVFRFADNPVPELAGAVRLLLERAEQVGAVHRAGVDGWCAGCALEGHLVFHPCLYARWAREIKRHYHAALPEEE